MKIHNTTNTPIWDNPAIMAHSWILGNSYKHWLGSPLITTSGDEKTLARSLYLAPFVLVSHNTDSDPRFNYANSQAQALWELDWNSFVGKPSRVSAETEQQAQRIQALQQASRTGFITGYTGVRISSTGRRFRILEGIIWNLLDSNDVYCGQAAMFANWEDI